MGKSWTTRKNKQALQRQLSVRDGGSFCHYCGVELATDDELPIKGTYQEYHDPDLGLIQSYSLPSHIKHAFIDHKHPRKLGGGNDLENLVLSCRWCNGTKGAIPYDEYIALFKG